MAASCLPARAAGGTLAVSSERLGAYLEEAAAEPRVAGTPADLAAAERIAARFEENGLAVERSTFDVLLSYPEKEEVELVEPVRLRLATPEGALLEKAASFSPEDLVPWNAYAASGEALAEVVYANFARPEDFEALEALGVPVRGRIVLARYGQGYRGGKTFEAEKRGAAAIVFYSDPAQDGYVQGDPLPKGPWGPPDHFQRGSNVYDFRAPGDPRRHPEVLPKIPSIPLSYADASSILEPLAGPAAPKGWQGGLPFTYHVGPGPSKVHLTVRNRSEVRRIVDVLGRLAGRSEPEKAVYLSSHHDAWTQGAMDDGLGTAIVLELSRAFGDRARRGRRPRRTLVFASWDAEEYTLTGSTEWGEAHAAELGAGAVAVLNVDAYRWGREFTAIAVPSLKGAVLRALAQVPDPDTGRPIEPPDIGVMGSGSDYTVFLNHAGVPAVETMFTGVAGVYHSIYDRPDWLEKRVDPGLRYAAAMARIVGAMTEELADSELLPFDGGEYASRVAGYLAELEKAFPKASVDWSGCESAAKAWSEAAKRFDEAKITAHPPAQASCANDALMRIERDLLDDRGLPGRPWFKHVLFAPRPTYEAMTLPGLREALEAGDSARAKDQAGALEAALRRAAATQSRAADCLSGR